MRIPDDNTLKAKQETRRRNEVIERHLSDTEADEEKPLCGADNSDSDPIAAVYHLEDRLCDHPVGT